MSARAQIEVVEDVAGAAARRIADAVRAGGQIALSGGSTPRAAHERVAMERDLDWSATTLGSMERDSRTGCSRAPLR